MSQFLPVPDPRGSLEPPRRNPPTAVALATPDPENPSWGSHQMTGGRFLGWRHLAVRLLEVADQVGDSIRRALVTR